MAPPAPPAEEEAGPQPVQMHRDPLDWGITESPPAPVPAAEEESITASSSEEAPPSAPASSTTTPSPPSEEAPPSEEEPPSEEAPPSEEEPTFGDAFYEKWRNGHHLWLLTCGGGPVGGYIIDYASRPRAVSRWHRRIGQTTITPLPDGVRLLYTQRPEDEPQAHVREFAVEEVESMDLEALAYMYAAELYEDIWEDVPGDSTESPRFRPMHQTMLGSCPMPMTDQSGRNCQTRS